MTLRKILAEEGLLRAATLTLSKKTVARLSGGSSAVRMGVAEVMLSLPGRSILKFKAGHAAGYGKDFTLKPGWARLVSSSDAKNFSSTLEEFGFSVKREGPDVYLSKIAATTPGSDQGGFVYIRAIQTLDGNYVLLNDKVAAGSALATSLEKERRSERGFEGFSASLSR